MQVRRTMGVSRDGRHGLVITDGALHQLDLHGDGEPRILVDSGVREAVGIGREIWVVRGDKPELVRFDQAGAMLGTPLALSGGDGPLRPTALGPPGAIWGGPPATMISVVDGELLAQVVPGDPDWATPVTVNRWLTVRGSRLALSDVTTERWSVSLSTNGRVVDGAVLLDGRSVMVVYAGPDGVLSHLAVHGLQDGRSQAQLKLKSIDFIRVAPARAMALLRSGPRTLSLLDLRFGRIVREHNETRDVVDAAIDHDGQLFLVRFADGEVEIGSVRTLLADAPVAGGTASAAVANQDEAIVVANAPDLIAPAPDLSADLEIATPADDDTPFHQGHAALSAAVALRPRRQAVPLPEDEALALLERQRDLIAALLGLAVASAWNEGRLAFPDKRVLPFRTEVAGILSDVHGLAKKELATAEARQLQTELAYRAAEATVGDRESPMSALANEFGLSTVAKQILMAIAAPALWGEFARLYGILGNDEKRPLVDELIVSQILAPLATREQIAAELDRTAPLMLHGLVRIGEGKMRPFLALSVEPVVLRLLRSVQADTDLRDVSILRSQHSLEDLLIPRAIKDAVVQQMAKVPSGGPTRIVLRGRDGSGRHTLLATLAAAAGRAVGVIDTTMILRDLSSRIGELRDALKRAHLLGLIPCVDGLEGIPADDMAARDVIRQILVEHPGPLAVRLPWDGQAPLPPGYLPIDLPLLSIGERVTAWRQIVTDHHLLLREPDELAARYSVGPGVIIRGCEHVRSTLPEEELAEHDVTAPLEAAVRQHLATKLGATATRVERLSNWTQVVLPPDIQDSVFELIARIKHRRTVYDTWGFDRVLTTARGVTALFSGGPGTGKTLVASAIANELGMDLYRVDLSRIMSKWIGETEQNLAKLFDAAEDGHAIILFDEADSLFAKRTEVRSSVDRYANLGVNYLLQRLDSFEGIAILTTNFGTSIDAAFKRRLSLRLTFPFPDEEAREALWKSHLPAKLPTAGAFDLAELSRKYRLSGGYIRNATLRAAFLAAEERSPLTQDHLERAIKAEFREIGKIAESGVLE